MGSERDGRIYLDYAATTPVREEVLAAMLPHFGASGFNASSQHAEGRAARAVLDAARTSVARVLGVTGREIVFAGSGSEADNLAIFGVGCARRGEGTHILTVATEHRAVLQAMDALRSDGFAVTVLGVDEHGRLDPAGFAAALRPDTILASVMLANNELGTVHPVAELGALCRRRGVTFHCDAVAAPGRLSLREVVSNVDLLTLSSHKFYGPKGVGALYVRRGTPLSPQIVGGGQESGRRAGTENVAGIAGFARALELADAELPAEAPRLARLRDDFEAEAVRRIVGCRVNAVGSNRLPNVSSLSFSGLAAQTLLVRLDLAGLAVSLGSACAAGSSAPSHVLAATGMAPAGQAGTVRFSFGRSTTSADARRALEILAFAVAALRVAEAEVGTSEVGAINSHARV